MQTLVALLAGPSGKPSTTRTLTAVVVASIMFTWTYVSVAKLELQPMSETQVALVVGALGMKVWQRGKETSTQKP